MMACENSITKTRRTKTPIMTGLGSLVSCFRFSCFRDLHLERRQPAPHRGRIFLEHQRSGHDVVRAGRVDQGNRLAANAAVHFDLGSQAALADDLARSSDLAEGG